MTSPNGRASTGGTEALTNRLVDERSQSNRFDVAVRTSHARYHYTRCPGWMAVHGLKPKSAYSNSVENIYAFDPIELVSWGAAVPSARCDVHAA